MSLQIYNTLTRTVERFKPLRQDAVKVYYCGPTPYNYAHIGNLRAYLFEDFVVRTLRFLGYKAQTVMNITDIDDKTIRDSQKSGKTLKEFTEFYAGEFLTDLDRLGIQRADTIAPISTLIPDMGAMIQGLLDRGYAYLADDGSIYYRVSKFKKYGELAHLDMSGMISSVRINNDEYEKDQVADFALWKAYDEATDGPNFWEIGVSIPPHDKGESEGVAQKRISDNITPPNLPLSREGGAQETVKLKGRPGWHIECSACNMRYLGPQIDIHMGGIDNLFPHHQNEVAQTEAYTGKQFAKYWMHGGHLHVDNKKMSKSAGNFYTLRDVIEKMSPLSERLVCRGFRLMALQNQYRENFNFTWERLQAAINTISGLDEMMKRLGRYTSRLPETDEERNTRGRLKFHDITPEFRENQQYFMQEFVEKLEDDFDTNSAMTIVYELQSYINAGIDEEFFSRTECQSLVGLMQSWDSVIHIFDWDLLQSEALPTEIEAIAVARYEAKLAKNWTEADKLRDELTGLGYKMIDEKDGWRVEKISA